MNAEILRSQSKESSLPPQNSPSVTYVLNYVNTSIKVVNSLNLSVEQGLCFICLKSLRSSFMKIKKQKKKCYYCSRSVCSSCAGIKMIPKFETKRFRICVACFNITVGKYFRQLTLAKSIKTFVDEEELEREQDLKKILELKEKVRAKERDVKKKAEEIEEIKDKIRDYEQFNQQVTGRDLESNKNTFAKLSQEMKMLEEEEVAKTSSLDLFKRKVSENESFLKCIESQKEAPLEEIHGGDSEVLNLLRDQAHYLRNMKRVYQSNSENLILKPENNDDNSCLVF